MEPLEALARGSWDSELREFRRSLLEMDRVGAKRVLETVLAALPVDGVVEQLVIPSLEEMGREWEAGRLALSQIYMGGRICEELVDILLPAASPYRKDQPAMAVAVLEDHHLLGKRMVYSSLRAAGFELLDFGRVNVETLILRTQQEQISILLISTLMLPSALRIREVSSGLRKAGWTGKIIVGGAPFRFDSQLWKEVGADGTSANASGAASLVTQIAGDAR